MVSLSAIKLNLSAVDGGVWRSDPWGLGFKLLVASGRNQAYVAAIRDALRLREKDEAAWTQKVSEALARHILKGWEGLDDESGKPIPYSYEQALEFMTSPETLHIREMVNAIADETAGYLIKSKADAGKD